MALLGFLGLIACIVLLIVFKIKRKKVKTVLICGGVSLILMIVGANIEAEPKETSAPTIAPPPTATLTPEPTPTPEITASPMPTATPKPTLDQFKEMAESPSYEDLSRYPEKYKTTPIKIRVRVKDVGVDKMLGLLEGGYLCTINGEELVARDGRIIKEPKLLKDDRVTIYGYGRDLTVMQKKQEGLIFDKVIDEWYIPTVQIEYVVIE